MYSPCSDALNQEESHESDVLYSPCSDDKMQNANETFQTLMNTNELPRLESYLTRIKETLAQWYPYVKEEKKILAREL